MNLPNMDGIKDGFSNAVSNIKDKLSRLNVREKNNLILIISAALIVLAVIIAIIGNVASKNKDKEPQAPVDTVASQNATSEDATKPDNSSDGNINTDSGIYKIITKDDDLNIRVQPNGDSSTTGSVVNKGAECEVICVYNGFGFVIYNGNHGWINMTYAEYVSASTARTSKAPGKYIVNSYDGSLSLRDRPDGSLGTAITNGTEVEILAVYEGFECEWGLVEYNGEVGWLPFTYLK